MALECAQDIEKQLEGEKIIEINFYTNKSLNDDLGSEFNKGS